MLPPFPYEMPMGGEVPPPTEFERFVEFLWLYYVAFSLVLLALPRRWFVWCVRTLFPFLPERLEKRREEEKD